MLAESAAGVLVGFFQHAHLASFLLIVFGSHFQGHCFQVGHGQVVVLGHGDELALAFQGASDFLRDAIVVEVGIGDGGEKSVYDHFVYRFGYLYMIVVEN